MCTCIVELQGDIILTKTQLVWSLILCSLFLRKSVPQIQKLFRIVATEHMSPTNFNKAYQKQGVLQIWVLSQFYNQSPVVQLRPLSRKLDNAKEIVT